MSLSVTINKGWGRPKYGVSRGNTWRTKEGNNVFRYLPPMGSLAEEGRWSIYVTTHFGYAGVNPEDPSKPKARPFRCIQEKDFRTGIITEDCPQCDLIETNKKKLAQSEGELKARFIAEGKDERETAELLNSALGALRAWVKSNNPDRKHYINAMTPDGKEFGQVAISHRTKSKQLDPLFKRLQDEESIDPLALDQGVLINIFRTGKMLDATDVVTAVTQKVEMVIEGKKVKLDRLQTRPLTEDEANRALKECRDLTTVGGTVLTREQIKDLTLCDGSPEAVDAIFKPTTTVTTTVPVSNLKTTSTATTPVNGSVTTSLTEKMTVPATTEASANALGMSDEKFLEFVALQGKV